jgi:hypothetical protein
MSNTRNYKKSMGRPKINDTEKLRHQIKFKVNDHGLKKLSDYVTRSGKTQSEVIREILFQRKLKKDVSQSAVKTIALMLGGLADDVRVIETKLSESGSCEKSELIQDIQSIKRHILELAEVAIKPENNN